jgi:hypothetical protein
MGDAGVVDKYIYSTSKELNSLLNSWFNGLGVGDISAERLDHLSLVSQIETVELVERTA